MYLLRAHTYFIGDNPSACVNCHIMTPYYATWSHSSHGRIDHQSNGATCNDCHVPHQNLAVYYGFKAVDGLKHTAYFVGHMEHQAIKAETLTGQVVMDNCIRCHTQLNTEFVKTGRMGYMQHPGYEMALQGIHGQRGVSCADCHMPYKQEGGVKFSDHRITSPLANIDRTCQTCHRQDAEVLKQNVYERQAKTRESRTKLEKQLAAAHIEAKFAWEKGATEAEMKPILQLIRSSQWRWDYAFASHGASFHAPQEVQRLFSDGLVQAQEARLMLSKVLAKHGFIGDVPMPDISTKAKAQEYIGLDMKTLNENKQRFLQEIEPKWIEEAKKNEKLIEL
jgi:cytochrome c nitrite reductase small subunit